MRELPQLISVLLLVSCAAPGDQRTSSNLEACATADVTPTCGGASIPITAGPKHAPPAIQAGSTYAIDALGSGVGYVSFTPSTSGVYTFYFSSPEHVAVCDLTPSCESPVTSCASFERAEQYAVQAGLHYAIEVRTDLTIQIAPPVPPPTAAIVFAATLDGQAATDLYTASADGTDVVRLTNTPGAELYPTWSPDHTRIAFVREFQLFVVDADGTDEHLIAPHTGKIRRITTPLGSGGMVTVGPAAWSPDGTRLAYPYPNPDQILDYNGDGTELVDESDGTTIHFVNADGTNDTALANAPDGTLNTLAWGPNDTLSFSQDYDCYDCVGFYMYAVMKTDGTGYRLLDLSMQQIAQLAWTPDGSRWVYLASGLNIYFGQPFPIYTSSAFGTDQLQLPELGWNPKWSPAADRIAYLGVDGIHIVNADGSDPHRIVASTTVQALDWGGGSTAP